MCDVIINDSVNDIDIERIEKKCREQNHLSQTELLKQRIFEDEVVLKQHGITFKQLEDFFEKIIYHMGTKSFKSYSPTEKEFQELQKYQIGSTGWCLWNIQYNLLFNDRFLCVKITWGGAELCPFQSVHDKKYHGYEYGSHDWIFIDRVTLESIHIGDLLFHQITKHHFFQSPGPYRVDPLKLIKFFNLRPNKDYSTSFDNKYAWSSKHSGSCSKTHFPDRVYLLEDYTKFASDEDKKSVITMIHERQGLNEVYYNDENAILIINDPTNLPETLNGLKYSEWSDDSIGYTFYTKTLYKTITPEEEITEWISKSIPVELKVLN